MNKDADNLNYTEYGYNTEKNTPDRTTIDVNIHSYPPSYSSNVTSLNETAEKAMKETAQVYRESYGSDYGTEEIKVTSEPKVTQTKKQTTSVSKENVTKTASSSDKSKKTAAADTSKKSTAAAETKTDKSKTSAVKTQSTSVTQKVQDRFWIQIATYASKKNADEARSLLEENKLPCEVFTITGKDGNLLYRVRVGAYTTKSEAEYWKTKIKAIPLFNSTDAYVTNSSAQAK